MTAENLDLDFSSMPNRAVGGEVIEILDNNKEDIMNEHKREEVLVKIEPDQADGEEHSTIIGGSNEGESRRSERTRIANRQFEDYELYITTEEEEVMLARMEEAPANEEEDEEVPAAVAHYIMVHYKEKEGIKKKKRNTSPSLDSTSLRQESDNSEIKGRLL